MSLQICAWKHGKKWAYSITYDEALSDLHKFAVPIHEELNLPGHVEVVVGQMGEVRNIGSSSFNGFKHMGADELKDLLARGWGVGNHSWSHKNVEDDLNLELRKAKEVLEDAIGRRVTIYCSPGDNRNMSDPILKACRRYGYLGAMSLTDAVNQPEDELFWLNRCPNTHMGWPPFFSAFNPWHRIRQAQEMRGWIIDYCHCPLEGPVHAQKDCSYHELRQRLETILTEAGDEVWTANADEALDYHNVRRRAAVETIQEDADALRYRLACDDLPEAIMCRELTVAVEPPAAWRRPCRVTVNGQKVKHASADKSRLLVTVSLDRPVELEVMAVR